jgi:uncharacterized protein
MRPFIVGVADLHFRTGAKRHDVLTGKTAAMVVTETRVPDGSTLDVDVVLSSVPGMGGGVLATGTAATTWLAECRRCSTPIAGRIEVAFTEEFVVDAVDGETYPIHQESVDLEVVAREAILLDLPLAPLCREECAGLCPTCGTDLNDGTCSCVPAVADPRWGALSVLSFEGTDGEVSDDAARDGAKKPQEG